MRLNGRTYPGTYRFIEAVLRPGLAVGMKRHWSGGENLPHGAFIAVSNHVTNLDAITLAYFLVDHRVPVKFLAKSELFDVPVVGRLLAGADQIRVRRGTKNASDALASAKAALAAGECVGIFPEGTLTRDPDMWPMKAKTGAARLALEMGVPVIPVAQWGTQDIIARYGAVPRPGVRRPVYATALPAVDLTDLAERPRTAEVMREATKRIMADLTAGVAALRGQTPPEHVWDMAVDGDPRTKKHKN